jgi:hypothetical protein
MPKWNQYLEEDDSVKNVEPIKRKRPRTSITEESEHENIRNKELTISERKRAEDRRKV